MQIEAEPNKPPVVVAQCRVATRNPGEIDDLAAGKVEGADIRRHQNRAAQLFKTGRALFVRHRCNQVYPLRGRPVQAEPIGP